MKHDKYILEEIERIYEPKKTRQQRRKELRAKKKARNRSRKLQDMATKLDLADAQFIGFNHGRWNRSDIIGLVEGMGLTKSEWKKWKEDYPNTSMSAEDIKEINEHFKQQILNERKRQNKRFSNTKGCC